MLSCRLISRFSDIPWPPRSPDFTDLFLCLKAKVYATRSHSTEQLKDCITDGIETINGALLQDFGQRFE
jgi:hypothetical protein